MVYPLVTIILGSDSDLPVMAETAKIFESANIPFELEIASAHRSPEYVKEIVKNAEKKGIKVFVAAAGMAAALPGVVAAETILPVIGVPMDGSALKGVDALYSMVQMPPGIPVATVAVGKAGATNAAILAIEILATSDKKLQNWLKKHKETLKSGVLAKSKALKAKGYKKYIDEMKK